MLWACSNGAVQTERVADGSVRNTVACEAGEGYEHGSLVTEAEHTD